jgi:hypothetical protein
VVAVVATADDLQAEVDLGGRGHAD